MSNNEKIVFSAIQPSGIMTLGNYIGAIKNWVMLQNEYKCFYSLADLHTVTVRQSPEEFYDNTIKCYALLIACGIDVKKSLLFIQSHVNTHAQLAWILSCYTQFGELSRMTQFKLKSSEHNNNVNVGLFMYPSLQVADILLYKADIVPIGVDQKQHLELSRNVAERFNGIYGKVFTVPEPYICKSGAKIMSLQEPTKKMSKSDKNINSFISVLDSPDIIIKKFKRAVTDSEAQIYYGENKDGINNLINIYSSITNNSIEQIENEFKDKGYGDFKIKVAECVIEHLKPIRETFNKLIQDKEYLIKCYKNSAEVAYAYSEAVLKDVMEKIGFISK